MDTTQTLIENYLAYCSSQNRLDEKTLKAYRIDLRQFSEQTPPVEFPALSSAALEAYIAALHRQYKPKTVKRKIASVKAFFHYLEYKDILIRNPFNKLQIRFREPAILPKTIPLPVVETFLTTIYRQRRTATTLYQKRNASLAAIDLHITPHMFRHTFATSLLEADVDIRYIQEMLGHSSINVTQIYTHVAVAKQRNILATKHPRKDFHI